VPEMIDKEDSRSLFNRPCVTFYYYHISDTAVYSIQWKKNFTPLPGLTCVQYEK